MRQLFRKLSPLAKSITPALPWSGGIAGVMLLVLIVVWIPKQQVPASVTDDKERIELENANRQTALQALGGLFFLVTAGLTLKNLQLTEDKSVTDRFSKAVEMLADDKLEMRLGGIYSLERIARDSKEDHPVVMEVLTAFIREKTGKIETAQGMDEEVAVKPSQDVQSALTVIGRRNTKNDQRKLNLQETHIRRANLDSANLKRAILWHIDLEESILWEANLEGVILRDANLKRAILREANLRGGILTGIILEEADLKKANLEEVVLSFANLKGAQLEETNLSRSGLGKANLEGTNLRGANLENASLKGTNLRGANLNQAHLEGASLRGANLENADLSKAYLRGTDLLEASLNGVENLTEAQLSQAKLCCTKLPKGINLDPNRDCKEFGIPVPHPDESESNT